MATASLSTPMEPRRGWNDDIFIYFISTKKVRQVTVTGSANGLVLEMFLDQVINK